ncbi:hypothetical protein BTO23_11565 [Aliivibrio sifiae]|uniref:Uncharacterized protein n=1 Tax=Aliivibrio sifiae TaxID=566293 RepID=A0A2S7X5X8_9GAMM|nr:hypothetical protein BTO23_11565 [Aliivibrio sifiae]
MKFGIVSLFSSTFVKVLLCVEQKSIQLNNNVLAILGGYFYTEITNIKNLVIYRVKIWFHEMKVVA